MENLNFVNDQEDTRETLNLRVFFFFVYRNSANEEDDLT